MSVRPSFLRMTFQVAGPSTVIDTVAPAANLFILRRMSHVYFRIVGNSREFFGRPAYIFFLHRYWVFP